MYETDLTILALTVWREARGENYQARLGVAMSVLNRVERPKWWGKNVWDVCTKKWQYSSLTAPGDPQLVLWPTGTDKSWLECVEITREALAGKFQHPFPGADSYHDISISSLNWAKQARFCGQSGRLKFYDVDFDYEAPTKPV